MMVEKKMGPVTIAGCGALGSLLAARLIEGGIDVQAYQRAGEQLRALREDGITVKGDRTGTDRRFSLAAASNDPAELKPSSLVIVLVKSYHTESVRPIERILEEKGAVLTLQNGLGNHEKLAEMFGPSRLAAGVDTYGAHRISPGVIGWGGDGYIIIGPWQEGTDMAWVADLLAGAGLNVTYVADPRIAIWKKLAINAMVNTTAALTRMNNGEMRDNSFAMELMKQLGREAVEASERAGVYLDFEEIWNMHVENLERTAANKPSMLQDVGSGRQTEIDAISGGVLGYAQSDQEFPYTRSVYSLIKAMDVREGY